VPSAVNGSWYPWFDPYLKEQDWDKVIILDADIMIHWDAPNMFEEFKDIQLGVVLDSSDPMTVGGYPHLRQWAGYFDVTNDPRMYFNAGFVVTNRECYNTITDNLIPYFEHWVKYRPNGLEQTPLNIIVWDMLRYQATLLEKKWNDMIMHNYDFKDGEINFDFIDNSWIWHFTGRPYSHGGLMGGCENRANLMKQTFEKVKDNYKSDWSETLLREI
jgi:lipopolysaccharide biosynthesis glycosyltransferase